MSEATDFKAPRQLLPKEAYLHDAWLARERRELFGQAWTFACAEGDLAQAGDYHCVQAMDWHLVVMRRQDGTLGAFHNICRHRGCEVLEGSGNTGGAIVCPYHSWTYTLEGDLRGVPHERECFDGLAKEALSLHPASVGIYRGLVFVNPSPRPADAFEDWIANLDDYPWPQDLNDGSLEYKGCATYEMRCNWKVFYENAIDGYHLGYLHANTLGRLYPGRQTWMRAGRNLAWYALGRDGQPAPSGEADYAYPNVVMLFPMTILSPGPWGLSISTLEPVAPDLTNMHTLTWAAPGAEGFDPYAGDGSQPIRLADMETHPLESGNFQVEDMWIVEKIQRNLRSPLFKVGPMAQGPGAESPVSHFQEAVLDFVPADARQ